MRLWRHLLQQEQPQSRCLPVCVTCMFCALQDLWAGTWPTNPTCMYQAALEPGGGRLVQHRTRTTGNTQLGTQRLKQLFYQRESARRATSRIISGCWFMTRRFPAKCPATLRHPQNQHGGSSQALLNENSFLLQLNNKLLISVLVWITAQSWTTVRTVGRCLMFCSLSLMQHVSYYFLLLRWQIKDKYK